MIGDLEARIPDGPIAEKWSQHKFDVKLVNPANKRRFEVIVVGSGLAGAAAAATLGELGYRVKLFTFHDTPRRAHSIAAQGGINAAKNYPNDGDSVYRLFYDTVKGGDFRAREGNVYRLAEVSVNIIDQCVAQGVPFAREYGGLLDNRSFGGAQVSRTFYARGQTGQQLLLGAYQALAHQVARGTVELHTRSRDARPRGEGRSRRPASSPATSPPARCSRGRLTRSPSAPAGTATPTTCRPTPRRATSPPRGGPTSRARSSPTPASRRSTPRASRAATTSRQAHADVGVAAQRRPGLDPEAARRPPLPRPDPGRRPRLLPRASLPRVRQPRAPRRGVTRDQDRGRRRPRRRTAEERRVPRLPGVDRAPRSGRRSRSATATSSRCTSASPTRTRTRCPCASTPPSTTRWAGSGSTTT